MCSSSLGIADDYLSFVDHGGKDYLVVAEPLIERLRDQENVELIRVQKEESSEVSSFPPSDLLCWIIDNVVL